MFGIGNWIRGHIADALYEHHTSTVSQRTSATPLALHGQSYISVHPISNGYILQVNSNSVGYPTQVYCADQQAISEQLITLIARDRMGIPSHVNLSGAQANLSGPPLQSKF